MKKFIVSIIILCGLFAGCNKPQNGEKWMYIYNSENPFCKPDTLIYDIVEVRDGYVQYTDADGDTASCSTYWFKIGSKRITESN